jgi:hypothetical protein
LNHVARDPALVEQCLKDLVWAVESPSLLPNSVFPYATVPAVATGFKLDQQKVDAEHLAREVVFDGQYRVGRYFEKLILYWLRFVCGFEIIAAGHAIRERGKTIGEIDVLFRDKDGRQIHWELAVKFYLQYPEAVDRSQSYLGPNPKDRLDRKVQRLFGHQLKLGHVYFPEVEIRQAFVKGHIFYAQNTSSTLVATSQRPTVAFLAENHSRGRWLRFEELDHWLPVLGQWFQVLRKPFWLAGYNDTFLPESCMNRRQLTEYCRAHFVQSNASPILVSQRAENESSKESLRFFIVSDTWPAIGRDR